MGELVDPPDLGSGANKRGGSSPPLGIVINNYTEKKMAKDRFVLEGNSVPNQRGSGANGFEGYESEDGDTYRSFRLSPGEGPLYVDIKSSNEDGTDRAHTEFTKLLGKGKRIRVTIEVL